MLKMTEIKKMDAPTVNEKVAELEKRVFEMNLSKNVTSLEKPHLKKEIKKDIARLKTHLSSMALGE